VDDPRAVLLCPPDEYDVVDVKNPHMEDAVGTVDRARARRQWEALRDAFTGIGVRVETIDPVPGCEDMVFCANQTLTVPGEKVCVLSHMRFESRRREVPAFARWFEERGYRVLDPFAETTLFEGAGDALWHPRRRVLWAGHGFRTGPEAHAVLAAALGVPVVSLALEDERFYHLDTCLCPVDEQTALVFPGAFPPADLDRLRGAFPRLIEVDEDEAVHAFACNAAAFFGTTVVIEARARRTAARLEGLGYRVVAVDTSEFLKSGGSVFCLKQFL